jgi:Fe-S-cluster-containing hydrogenase component 2
MYRQVRLSLDANTCRVCRRCLAAKVCKVQAIMRLDLDEPPFLDVHRCFDCRVCIPACTFGAITVGGTFGSE